MVTLKPSCRELIMRFIENLNDGALFTSQDCVIFGNRSAVDKTLSRLLKAEIIERLAVGVYAPSATRKPHYTPMEIASAKAASSGHTIFHMDGEIFNAGPHSSDLRKKSEENDITTFITTGCTTRFRLSDDTYVLLKRSRGRQTRLSPDKSGDLLRLLLTQDLNSMNAEALYRSILRLNQKDFQQILAQAHLLPSQLREKLQSFKKSDWIRYAIKKTSKLIDAQPVDIREIRP